jgi:hypothetical protein
MKFQEELLNVKKQVLQSRYIVLRNDYYFVKRVKIFVLMSQMLEHGTLYKYKIKLIFKNHTFLRIYTPKHSFHIHTFILYAFQLHSS